MEITGGDINGAGLVAMLLFSLSIPATLGAKPQGLARYLAGFVVGVALLFGLITTQIDPQAQSQPYTQIAVMTFTITVAFITLPRFLLQVVMAIVLIPAGLFLCQQFHTLVATEQFTAEPTSIKVANKAYEAEILSQVQAALGGAESEKQGFLLELPIGKALPEELQTTLKETVRLEPKSEWHTPLTGIYENWVKPTGLFYPGIAKGGSAAMELAALDSKVERVPVFKAHRRRGPLLSTKSNYAR